MLNYLERIVKFFETNELPQDYKKQELILRTYKVVPGKSELQQLTDNLPFILLQNYDTQYGGFGAGQKFPSATAWDYMLYAYEKTSNKEFLDAATNTLNHMYNENYINDPVVSKDNMNNYIIRTEFKNNAGILSALVLEN